MKRRSLFPLLLFSFLGLVILVSLGLWQLSRLSEKRALIALVESRMAVPAISLPDALKADDPEYARIILTGRYLGQPLRKLAAHNGNPAQQLIQPFLSDSNHLLLVLRGVVPDGAATAADTGSASLEGILRVHDQGQGLFDPENDPVGNQWNWWDVPEMLATVDLPVNAEPIAYVLHRLPQGTETTPPIALPPKAELRNNHLGYAITWFGLAAALLVVTAAYAMRR